MMIKIFEDKIQEYN